jgi:regulator of protease activity HflC (stomatin/prohibitin superfamily)
MLRSKIMPGVKFEKMNPDGTFPKTKKHIKKILIGIAVLCVACGSFKVIPAGHTGVVMTLGKVSDNVLQEGFHLKVPFVQDVEVMSNKIQVYETAASAVSKDLQTVNSTIAVNYKISTDASAKIYKNIGTDYKTVLIASVVQECMKSATAKYTAEQLITERNVVGDEIKTSLDEKLNEYGIYIEKFNIVNFDFSQEFNTAIEAKQVAEQNLIKTKTEQQQAIVVANAEAEKKVIAADAEAKAILAEAQAQADANKLLEQSLSSKVLQYEKITKWNGELPKVSGENDLLIDVGVDGASQEQTTAASTSSPSN